MSLHFLTRAAQPKDLERIIDLNLKLFKYESSFNDGLNLSWTLSPEGKSYFKKRLDQDKGVIFVAELDDRIIAYLAGTLVGKINYRSEKAFAKIDNMFVLPDHRGQGVGSALVENFYSWSKEQGAEKILTEVKEENSTAQEFYSKNNFSPHSTVLERKIK